MDNHEQKARGQAASDLLNNPLFEESIAEMKKIIMKEWAEKGGNKDDAERLWIMHTLTDKFQAVLMSIVANGIYAKEIIDQEEANETFAKLNETTAQ